METDLEQRESVGKVSDAVETKDSERCSDEIKSLLGRDGEVVVAGAKSLRSVSPEDVQSPVYDQLATTENREAKTNDNDTNNDENEDVDEEEEDEVVPVVYPEPIETIEFDERRRGKNKHTTVTTRDGSKETATQITSSENISEHILQPLISSSPSISESSVSVTSTVPPTHLDVPNISQPESDNLSESNPPESESTTQGTISTIPSSGSTIPQPECESIESLKSSNGNAQSSMTTLPGEDGFREQATNVVVSTETSTSSPNAMMSPQSRVVSPEPRVLSPGASRVLSPASRVLSPGPVAGGVGKKFDISSLPDDESDDSNSTGCEVLSPSQLYSTQVSTEY